MINIRIIAIGKIKDSYLEKGIEEYKKRISKFAKMEILELKDSASDEEAFAKKEEAVSILSNLKNGYNIILAIDGEMLSSLDFAEKIDKIACYSNPAINFIIGGSHGLHESVCSKADYKLSFSKLTFPHQLMRLILLEQIYRAFKINNNETYHK